MRPSFQNRFILRWLGVANFAEIMLIKTTFIDSIKVERNLLISVKKMKKVSRSQGYVCHMIYILRSLIIVGYAKQSLNNPN